MKNSSPIKFWNPYSKKIEEESVYGDRALRLLYETSIGQRLSEVLSSSIFSKLYGGFQNSPLSRSKILPFIKNFHIQTEEFETGPFRSFNDFFSRRFLPGRRVFCKDDLPAFAEGRYLGFDKVTSKMDFPIKGDSLNSSKLLGDADKCQPFAGGPALIARLCPVDYHRFHFPDDGDVVDRWKVEGRLQSVNPVALRWKGDVFITNERQITILKTKNFGLLAYIEVGAIFVGKIIQTYVGNHFKRGDEKGYFLFGASTVIILGEPGKFFIDPLILKNSLAGLETFVRLGDRVALSKGVK